MNVNEITSKADNSDLEVLSLAGANVHDFLVYLLLINFADF